MSNFVLLLYWKVRRIFWSIVYEVENDPMVQRSWAKMEQAEAELIEAWEQVKENWRR